MNTNNENSESSSLNNDLIIVNKNDLKIILDRLGKQYMTDEAQKIVKKLELELRK